MAIVNERHSSSKPVQVDPKTGKPLPPSVPPRAASPSMDALNDGNSSGFFGSFFTAKNKKKMAAMESPPPQLKASGTLSDKESQEVEVISMFLFCFSSFPSFSSLGFWVGLTRGGADFRGRASHLFVLLDYTAHAHRYGPEGGHAYPRPVSAGELMSEPMEIEGLTLCRHTKDEMQRELLENMYRNDDFEDLLKESEFTIRRRKECQQMVESLSKAAEIVSQVQ